MKSVLRAATEAFVRAHSNVDYFPSFESVILSERDHAWRADQAHVSDEMVRLNVVRMIEAYALEPGSGGRSEEIAAAVVKTRLARDAAARGAVDEAVAAYRQAVAAAPGEGLVMLEFGRFLYELKAYDEAALMVEASVRRGTGPYGAYLYLAQIHYAARRYELAEEAIASAAALQPDRPGVVGMARRIKDKLSEASAPPVEDPVRARPAPGLLERIVALCAGRVSDLARGPG
jgi:tetratricopeptide (TPR) repeat protein